MINLICTPLPDQDPQLKIKVDSLVIYDLLDVAVTTGTNLVHHNTSKRQEGTRRSTTRKVTLLKALLITIFLSSCRLDLAFTSM